MTTVATAVFVETEAEDTPQAICGGAPPFGALLVARTRTLRAYANMLTGDRATAEDLIQDTFERALRGARQFRAGSNLTAWLRRIMRNLFTDRCRQGTRFVSMSGSDLADRFPDDRVPDPEADGEIDAREFLTTDDVQAALGAIDRSLREIFVMAHLQRQSYQSIAVTLGIPVSTVGTRLWRARARLRKELIRIAPAPGGAAAAAPPAVPARPTIVGSGGDPTTSSHPPRRTFSKRHTAPLPASRRTRLARPRAVAQSV